jgi:hypothetical protein
VLCKEALDLVEPIAAGDRELDESSRAHFESCPRCAGALASARRLTAVLTELETPAAPANFASAVLQRIRRERWRSEQQIDRLFNLAIVFAVLLVASAIVAMLNIDTVVSLSQTVWVLGRDATRDAMKQAVPTLATYVAAAGLLASALVMWWWAERRLQY